MKKSFLVTIISIVFISIAIVAYKYNLPKDITPIESDNSLSAEQVETTEISTLKSDLTTKFSEKYNKPEEQIELEINIETEAFAKGIIRFKDEGGGGIWLAANTKEGWELAFDGNGIISCDITTKFNFPTNMVPGCVDNEKDGEVVQR